eukprot:scaffold73953_cov32-Tisochrysis_lutea.AAC.6
MMRGPLYEMESALCVKRSASAAASSSSPSVEPDGRSYISRLWRTRHRIAPRKIAASALAHSGVVCGSEGGVRISDRHSALVGSSRLRIAAVEHPHKRRPILWGGAVRTPVVVAYSVFKLGSGLLVEEHAADLGVIWNVNAELHGKPARDQVVPLEHFPQPVIPRVPQSPNRTSTGDRETGPVGQESRHA